MAAVTGPSATVHGMAAAARPTVLKRPSTIPPPPPMSTQDRMSSREINLDWDEEELETAIYDEQQAPAPESIANGSNKRHAPLPSPLRSPIDEAQTVEAAGAGYANGGPEMYGRGAPMRDHRTTGANFGEGLLARPPRRTGTIAAMGALALLVVGGGIALFMLLRGDGADEKVAAAEPPAAAIADPNTGFDLIVEPSNVEVKLDGKALTPPQPPLQIRGLPAKEYRLEITGPEGFFNKTQKVVVEAGKAPRVVIALDAMEVSASFDSTPSGARVILSAENERTDLGKSPATAKLDPRKRYEVTFKRDGFITATRPVEFVGGSTLEMNVPLESTRLADRKPVSEKLTKATKAPKQTKLANPVKPHDDKPIISLLPKDPPGDPDQPNTKPAVRFGFLALGSKPPCKIFIDGRDTGHRTPKKGIKLKAGKHRVTLINNEHRIKESFSVTIKAGEKARKIKDWSSRIE